MSTPLVVSLSLPYMGEIQENFSTESNPKNCSCFSACFGSSKNKLSDNMVKASSNSKNKKTSLSTFRANKSLVKTAPAAAAVSEKLDRSTERTQTPIKKNNLATGSWMTFNPAAAPGQTNIKPSEKEEYEIEEDRFGEVNDLEKLIPFNKNPKRESKRTGSINSGSPPEEKNAVSTKPKVLQLSVSLPVLPDRRKEKHTDGERNNKVDPIVGMSIILVTLVIMLIWGKLCAIICTFAWFFMVPRPKAAMDNGENGLNSGGLDLDSEEYKKKVVLDGLLHRKRGRHHVI